jgi:hypothetical protein
MINRLNFNPLDDSSIGNSSIGLIGRLKFGALRSCTRLHAFQVIVSQIGGTSVQQLTDFCAAEFQIVATSLRTAQHS